MALLDDTAGRPALTRPWGGWEIASGPASCRLGCSPVGPERDPSAVGRLVTKSPERLPTSSTRFIAPRPEISESLKTDITVLVAASPDGDRQYPMSASRTRAAILSWGERA
jgi:hypothetical protein